MIRKYDARTAAEPTENAWAGRFSVNREAVLNRFFLFTS
jgi:hypothetical protein